jgi:hypothetical protein
MVSRRWRLSGSLAVPFKRSFAAVSHALLACSLLSALLTAGCQRPEEGPEENVISFDRIADSLKQFDEVVIELKGLDGGTVDVVYRGKVAEARDVQRLRAPNWDGGRIVVSITGIKDGEVVYQVETRFDPATGTRDNVMVIVSPDAAITSALRDLALLPGDSIAYPPVEVSPSTLSDKTVEWKADPDGLLLLGPGYLKAVQAGEGALTARLKTNPSVSVSIPFSIAISGLVPESLSVEPGSLEIAAAGAPGQLTATVFPSGASSAVYWVSADTSVAGVDSTGRVHGKRQGETSISAVSRSRPLVTAAARIIVGAPVLVEKVAFAFESQDIFVGIEESLQVTVSPLGADPSVSFTLSDPSKATVQDGRITGTAVGTLSVIAASLSNPDAKDTLRITVKEPVLTDTVPPGRPVVRVHPAGSTRERRPVWSWTSGGGGAGAYQISLGRSVFDSAAITLSDTAYTPGADLDVGMHVLYVRERDAAGNWSPAGQAQVEIDTAGPSAPNVVGTSPTSSLPRWTWSSGGGGGAGVFRHRLGEADFPADAPESRDTVFALASAANGTTYTLFVQERDAAGNWSPAASHGIKYDLTRPTVAISLPQASGTFITREETVRISGTCTGPNGIAAVEYTLDGGAAVALTLGTGGSWTLSSLAIPNGRTSVIKVIATDNLGNQGEAQLSVLRDSDPPSPPASLSDLASPTNVATASWTWSPGNDGAAGSGLSGRYRWSLNAGEWTEVSNAAASGVTLAPGSNLFSVQEEDRAGNWSAAATDTVVLDNRAPDAVTFIGIDSSLTDDASPTWTWTPSTSNGGIAEYLLRLDAGAEFTWTGTTYTPTAALSDNAVHTLTVRQKDQVPGVVGAARSFSYRVKVNPPAAPTVRSAVASLANNGLTNNPGFNWTTGGGGNRKYRVKVNAETTYRVNGAAQSSFSLAATDADGTYTVYVSEQDDLGRYGPEGSFTIRLDRTPPQFANARIDGKSFPLRNGFITNAASLVIRYTSDGGAKSFSCTLADTVATVCRDAIQTDAAGNTAAFQTTVWRRSRVVFFHPDGTGDGSSWEEAAGDIQAQVDAGADGKEFWLASGDYTADNNSLTIWGITLNLLGGFFHESFPTTTQNRNKGGTILAHISTMGTYGTLDGIQFVISSSGLGLGLAMGSATKPATIIDCQFRANIEITLGANINFQNCQMIGVRSSMAPLTLGINSTINWDGGAIRDSYSTSKSYGIDIGSGTSATFRGALAIFGNKPAFSSIQITNNGNLEIANTVDFDCADISNGSDATGNCKGTVLTPD